MIFVLCLRIFLVGLNLSGLEEKVEVIKNTMATKDGVSNMPAMKLAVFEISDTVKRFENTQEKHERTLDVLSRRSIDQEANIFKKFRRNLSIGVE
ncbi:hypothetical protein [Pueribacillus theae]|uniref:hypothetical protein n=1 Tax=Pueribacillus theae TaxID=2171751 RepID=UPI0010583ABE|nr:hypothetical protein [Pueribacillus theae]